MSRKKKKSSYHHGALKEALLEEALVALKEKGVEKLTLRELARRTGVSHTAPYRHFVDKSDLLVSVASFGFEKLGEAMSKAYQEKLKINSLVAFQSVGSSYVEFALKETELFRLMFGSRLSKEETGSTLDEIAQQTFSHVTNAILRCQEDNFIQTEAPAEDLANMLWAHVHGFANLVIDGQLQFDNAMEVLGRYDLNLFAGLAPR